MLPLNEHSFELVDEKGQPVIGSVTGKKYEGTFAVKCVLTNSESMQVAVNAERYGQGASTLAQYFKLFNRALAEAEIRVMFDKEKKKPKAPGWWIDSDFGRDLLDQNVVFELYNRCMDAEKSWKDKLVAKTEETEKAAGIEPPKKV